MTKRATGTFEIKLAPLAAEDDDAVVGRMSIDKVFEGDLIGTSKGQMLAVRTDVQGSAGYVAMEHVRGSLDGKTGTFVLQHSGVMMRGASQLKVVVVPDSGNEGLLGLKGEMTIDIVDGKHLYGFEYTLP